MVSLTGIGKKRVIVVLPYLAERDQNNYLIIIKHPIRPGGTFVSHLV